jgi:hypothetical protein
MRTGISSAASPRRLRWQAAFTITAYPALSPIIWHHAFVSDTHMKNWRDGSDLILTWGFDNPDRKAKTASIPDVRCPEDSHPVPSNGGGYAFSKEAHHSY